MSLLVVNCFDWVGFHIVNTLLENGYEVTGMDFESLSKQDHLQMFFGRNSSFTLVTKESLSSYDLCIVVGNYPLINEIKAQYVLEINDSITSNSLHEKHIYITKPLLFGKWMPMTKTGMYNKNKFIPFQSNEFLEEAMYIDDFITHLLPWIEVVTFADDALINERLQEEKLENFKKLSDNRTRQRNLKKVLEHYERYELLYIENQ